MGNKDVLIIYLENYFTDIEKSLQYIIASFGDMLSKTVIIGDGIKKDVLSAVAGIESLPGKNRGFLVEGRQYCMDNPKEIEQAGHVYMLSSSLAGPVYDIKDMLSRMEGFEIWKMNSVNNRFISMTGKKAVLDESYRDFDDGSVKAYSETNLMLEPYTAVSRDKVPFVDMYAYVQETSDVLRYTAGEDIANSINYIRDNTEYDVNIIWDNIIKDGNMCDFVYNLKLNYILPSDISEDIPDVKIAMVLHIYYEDLAPKCFEYAKALPQTSDIYITTDSEEKCGKFKKLFMQGNFNKVESILIANRGRDVSALLTGAKNIVGNYDYVLFVHDKKVEHMDNRIKGESFAYKCFDNLLGSREYVKNIINTFEKNERLGLLCPPPPNHADYYPTLGYFDWGMNYDNTKALSEKLGLTVKIDWRKEPVSPLGTMFWFRPKAMKLLFDVDWEYEDFPPEPNGIDGTLLHAIERIYSYIVQQSGYYPAWVLNNRYAGLELNNMYYMLKKLDKHVFNVYGAATFNDLCSSIDNGCFNSNVVRSISTRKFIRYKLSGIYHRIIRK